MLQENVMPVIGEIQVNGWNNVWFQHNGAPPHNARCVKEFLNEQLPSRWIGRGGTQEWPPRSLDLTPMDFFSGET